MLSILKNATNILGIVGFGTISMAALSTQAQASSYDETLAQLKSNGCAAAFSEDSVNCYGITEQDLAALDLLVPASMETETATLTDKAKEMGIHSLTAFYQDKELQTKVLDLKTQANLDAMGSYVIGVTTAYGTKVTPAVAAVCAEMLGPKGCENYLSNGRFAYNNFQTTKTAYHDTEMVMHKFATTQLSDAIDAPEMVQTAAKRTFYRGAASTGYMHLASAASSSSPDDPTCPPELWDAMLQQAANNVNDQIEKRNEQVEPPDSVLDLSCFDSLTLGGISSVSIFFDPSVLINAILAQLQEYICDKATEAWNKTLGRNFDLSSYVKEYDGIIPGLSVSQGGNILDGASPVSVGVGAFPSTGIILPNTVGGGIVNVSDRHDGFQAQFPEGTFRIPCKDPADEAASLAKFRQAQLNGTSMNDEDTCRNLGRLSEHLKDYFK